MSLFMKRGATGASLYPPRIACYVCGAEVPADYPLFPEPSPPSPPPPSLASAAAIMSKPHFPFLMHHPPPLGCRPPSPGGVAKSCRVCYSSLMRQWDDYERTGVPTDKRVYWLKRIDGLSFASPEVQAQAAAEVRARVLGLFHQHPRSPHLRTSSPASSMAAPSLLHHHVHHGHLLALDPHGDRPKASSPLTIVTGNSSISPMATPNSNMGAAGSSVASSWLSRSAVISGDTRPSSRHSPLVSGPSNLLDHHNKPSTSSTSPTAPSAVPAPKQESLVTVPTVSSMHDNDSALDLSSGNRDRETKSRSSVVSAGAVSHHSSYQSDQSTTTTVTDILDLTLPDKNAAFEVCYVCGDEFKRGTLSYIFAKQVSSVKEPFYPSLMCHPRPPRSRPMDSAGRVQTCDECYDHLLAQWNQYEEEDDTPHADRNYSLRKRQTPMVDSTLFVCYICALDYHSSSLSLLYARPNSEGEPYYPFIEQHRPPPGASPISPQGMVQVCTCCYNTTKEKKHGFMKAEQPPPKKRPKFSSPRDPVDIHSPFGGDPINDPEDSRNQLPADLTCPLCRRKFAVGSFKLLHSQPPPAGGHPYFPFLSELPKPEDNEMEEDKQARVRACRACTTSLFNQWTTYQRDNVPIPERNYLYQSLIGPRSSQNTTARPHTPSSIRSQRSGRSERGAPKIGDEVKGSPGQIRPRSNSNPFGTDIRGRSGTIESRTHSDTNPISPAPGASRGGPVQQQCHSPSCHSVHSGASNDPSAPSCSKQSSSAGKDGPSCGGSKSSSSFYCFLCGLHSELTFARMLYSSAPGKKAPYFPFMKNHVPKQRAETLREDGTALVCTFCYHTVMSQWNRYQDARIYPTPIDPNNRVYNLLDYICYVCGVTTYRKRIRALRPMVSL